jgi:hypothetical protein
MFGTLGRDATHRLADQAPAGTISPGGFGRLLIQAIRRPAKLIGELHHDQRSVLPLRHTDNRFSAGDRLRPGTQMARRE